MVNARQFVDVFNPPLKFDVHNDFIVFSLSLSLCSGTASST